MARLFKVENAVEIARTFKESIGESNTLYFFIGKSSEWGDELTPDTPTPAVDEEIILRDNISGIKNIIPSKSALVIPRYNWVSGTSYAKYDDGDVDLLENSGDSYKPKNFYVMNSSFRVYKCIENNSNGESLVQPTGTSTSNISTGDGYVWKFMFDISVSLQNLFLTPNWIPVPTGNQKSSFQLAVESAATYTVGSPPSGHGYDAAMELGAKYLMLQQTLEGDESGNIPTSLEYRQIGVWLNPRLTVDGEVADATVYSVNDSADAIDTKSGRILLVENRTAVSRSPSQTETYQLILKI